MRVLFRVALALLIGIPLCLALVIFFLLEARGGASVPVEGGKAGSSERAHLGSQRPTA